MLHAHLFYYNLTSGPTLQWQTFYSFNNHLLTKSNGQSFLATIVPGPLLYFSTQYTPEFHHSSLHLSNNNQFVTRLMLNMCKFNTFIAHSVSGTKQNVGDTEETVPTSSSQSRSTGPVFNPCVQQCLDHLYFTDQSG